MLCLSLLLVLLTHPIRTAYVTHQPSFAAKLDRFYEKLERLTVSPNHETTTESKLDQWYHKLQKLNSLSPDNFYLSDEDEDLIVAMQSWGKLSADQLDGVAKELQRIRDERDEERSEYNELDDADDDIDDYHNDGVEFEEEEESDIPSPRPPAVTPSAYTRDEPFQPLVLSAVEAIAATNARPEILNDEPLSAANRSELRKGALANIGRVVRAGRCRVPQPRWLTVRQLAPAADTVYMPPCVQLHRCAPDSGCCSSEAEVCAPVQGTNVALPFYLQKADGTITVARMSFFNHTKCACVSRDTLQTTIRSRSRDIRPKEEYKPESRQELRQEIIEEPKSESIEEPRLEPKEDSSPEVREVKEKHREEQTKEEPRDERQNDWNAATQQPKLDQEDEDVTAPPQMRRCTCPAQFLASMPASGPCSCVCDWPDGARRRDCLPLSRGEEHFGMRDRVCVDTGNCSPPSCKYGVYDKNLGKCPARKYRRFRYHRRFHPEKTLVV